MLLLFCVSAAWNLIYTLKENIDLSGFLCGRIPSMFGRNILESQLEKRS
jgi:hypothetical protein